EYRLFHGLRLDVVHEALDAAPWVQGIQETVERLRAAGLEVWYVTDQPSWATDYLARWGIHDGVCSPASTRGARVGALLDARFEKWPGLQEKLKRAGIPPETVCHVGNGSNDIPIFEHVGKGIAFAADSPAVEAAADAVVTGGDLTGVLAHLV
ncbi:MAG: HAD hydrolase family protein, partial [Candidatus Thermoplasmatota archaeon]|nr:HAD hydrolase family protein [Candidatus Thermoplasmatota archaeon]